MGHQSHVDLVRGTLDLMVLRCLAEGSNHGFAVARWIRSESDERVGFEDAAVYQSLHRLQRRGMVSSEWGRSENNRRVRIYDLTRKGRTQLARDSEEFRDTAAAILRLLAEA